MSLFRSAQPFVRGVSLVSFVSVALWAALFSTASAEIVRSFSADYELRDDGSVLVTETIVYDFESVDRRGIYRNVKNALPQSVLPGKTQRSADIRLMSIKRDGQPEPFKIQNYDGLSVRIGDPAVTISGPHTYVITYDMHGAIVTYEDGFQELYWNATGDEWLVTIENVSVTVSATGAARLLNEYNCYQGTYKATSTCSVELSDSSTRFSTNNLNPGEQLTFAQAVALPAIPVAEKQTDESVMIMSEDIPSSPGQESGQGQLRLLQRIQSVVGFGVLGVFIGVLVSRKIRSFVRSIVLLIQVSILAVLGLFVLGSSLGEKGVSDMTFFAAATLPLAAMAFALMVIGIYFWRTKHDPDRTIVVQYEPYEDFRPMFTGVLFDNKLDSRDITASIVHLAVEGYIKITQTTDKVFWVFETTDYEITLLRPVDEVETEVQQEVLKMLFRYKAAAGSTMRLSDITKSQVRQRANYVLMRKMIKATERDLVARGFFEQRFDRASRIGIGVIIVLAGFLSLWIFYGSGVYGEAIVLIVLFIVFTIIFLMFASERRTARGYEALDHLKGFKQYLSITEAERYAFHNAPTKSPELFMEYLPYAIAFGVEKEWSELFSGIAMNPPDWHSSRTDSSFDMKSFLSDIKSFSTTLASSGASGSSGSGSRGGGSSGGGGGGGGGGSW
jgi:uncharacterized membrane protein